MFEIDFNKGIPIYQQIVDQTQVAIVKGILEDGDQMPSIRSLAKTLLVNQSTITRAYNELEVLGIIQTIPGRGTFVKLDKNKMELDKADLRNRLEDIIGEAIFYGISLEEIRMIYKKMEGKE